MVLMKNSLVTINDDDAVDYLCNFLLQLASEVTVPSVSSMTELNKLNFVRYFVFLYICLITYSLQDSHRTCFRIKDFILFNFLNKFSFIKLPRCCHYCLSHACTRFALSSLLFHHELAFDFTQRNLMKHMDYSGVAYPIACIDSMLFFKNGRSNFINF